MNEEVILGLLVVVLSIAAALLLKLAPGSPAQAVSTQAASVAARSIALPAPPVHLSLEPRRPRHALPYDPWEERDVAESIAQRRREARRTCVEVARIPWSTATHSSLHVLMPEPVGVT